MTIRLSNSNIADSRLLFSQVCQWRFFQGRPFQRLLFEGRRDYRTLILLSAVVLSAGAHPAMGQIPTSSSILTAQATPDTPLVAQSTAASSRPTLQLGSEGASVSELQGMLRLLGYYTGPVDGLYQDGTANAVAAFQRAAGLESDGVAGPATWNRLLPAAAEQTATTPQPSPSPSPSVRPTPSPSPSPSGASPRPTRPSTAPDPNNVELPTLRQGMRGPAIARLQERLSRAGFYDGEIDGVFGSGTQAAVEAFQRSNQLTDDGVVGPATWSVLLR
ncbi:MAG TPA: peptidoglycan-binding protein [Chroococcidiopsis sp.]